MSDKFCGISNIAWTPHKYYCWPVVVDAGYPQEPPYPCLINMSTTQKFFKNFMSFYAIKVLLLAASILASISSVVAAAEPITIFGVNFDHSPDEAREIPEDRFDCKFAETDDPTIYKCTKDNYELVKLESAGNHLVCFTFEGRLGMDVCLLFTI